MTQAAAIALLEARITGRRTAPRRAWANRDGVHSCWYVEPSYGDANGVPNRTPIPGGRGWRMGRGLHACPACRSIQCWGGGSAVPEWGRKSAGWLGDAYGIGPGEIPGHDRDRAGQRRAVRSAGPVGACRIRLGECLRRTWGRGQAFAVRGTCPHVSKRGLRNANRSVKPSVNLSEPTEPASNPANTRIARRLP